MATYAIDTAKAVDSLVESGMPAPQAKAVVATFAESQEQLATKADIQELKAEIKSIEGKIEGVEGKIEGVEGKIEGVEGKIEGIEGKIEGIEGKIDGLKAQITVRALLVGGTMVALLKALEYLGV